MVERREPSYTVGGWKCTLVQPLWTAVWMFLKKLKIELPHNLAMPLLGIYLEKNRPERIHAPQ